MIDDWDLKIPGRGWIWYSVP